MSAPGKDRELGRRGGAGTGRGGREKVAACLCVKTALQRITLGHCYTAVINGLTHTNDIHLVLRTVPNRENA